MIDGQLWLLVAFMVFTIIFAGALGVLCSKWMKRRSEMDPD